MGGYVLSLRERIITLFHNHSKRLFKYAIVGAIGSIEQIGITYVLTEFFHVWYIFSMCFGIAFAMTSNYILNLYWAFRDVIDYEKVN